MTTGGRAIFTDRIAHQPLEITSDPARLDASGFWVVVQTFEGALTAVRMGQVERIDSPVPTPAGETRTAATSFAAWESSLSETEYVAGVAEIRRRIAAGEVYQVNLCRVLSRRLPEEASLDQLAEVLRHGNPAPFAARIDIASAGLDLVCASPELYLRRAHGRVTSAPIKGTAPTADQLLPKDWTENVMITDLVRNDLSPVIEPGTVEVDGLCALEHHPGLVHLVSTVTGVERADVSWADIFAATYPPGSVSGAPKSTALKAIGDVEQSLRGPYCGAVGWVDADAKEASLAVGIRTFWAERRQRQRWLKFGTGAGITWDSDPQGEWCETVLKARRLIGLADAVTDQHNVG